MKQLLAALAVVFALQTFSQTEAFFSGPPAFHGAKKVGNYPNTDFLYTIPATGLRPIFFAAENLPAGLQLDSATGIISGVAPEAGEYVTTIMAWNDDGENTYELTLTIGSKLALTPPMGWNSWNVFADEIDEKTIMEIADAMVESGMRDIGYQYINIDDFWHAASRAADGAPIADPAKFPSGMKHLSDYVHSKGLKLGIYSCAGRLTCGEKFGGFGFEEIDAKTYAEWGIDLLKYDYCYAPWGRKAAEERYKKMGAALKSSGRSIVFSICEWGLRKPWKWGTEAGGSYWRTTPDIFDYWSGWHPWQKSFMSILKFQNGLEQYAGPGKWNDPDMLTVGNYGKGKATSAKGKYKGMSDLEYQTHFSLWCMLASPLLTSCDLRDMNDNTLNILLNYELTNINQDELGKQAELIHKEKGIWVYKKKLAGDAFALAIFNTTKENVVVQLPVLVANMLKGRTVRDAVNHFDITDNYRRYKLKPHETTVWICKKDY